MNHLGDHQGRDYQRTRVGEEEVEGIVMVSVVGVDVGV
jgi:hypothetical protein